LKLKDLTTNYTIQGITMLDSELYVLRISRKTADVGVYDTATFRYEQHRNWPTDRVLGRAGLSIVPVVPWEGLPRRKGAPPISCQIFTTLF